jgi:hypothetical protein
LGVSLVEKSLIAALAFACVMGTACHDVNGPIGPALNGSYAVTLVDGRTLPDTEIVAPSTLPGFPSCVMLRTSGVLVLETAAGEHGAGTFSITLNVRSVCAGQEGVGLTEKGTFSQSGSVMTGTETFPDHVETLTGRIDARSITIRGVFHEYTFAR